MRKRGRDREREKKRRTRNGTIPKRNAKKNQHKQSLTTIRRKEIAQQKRNRCGAQLKKMCICLVFTFSPFYNVNQGIFVACRRDFVRFTFYSSSFILVDAMCKNKDQDKIANNIVLRLKPFDEIKYCLAKSDNMPEKYWVQSKIEKFDRV